MDSGKDEPQGGDLAVPKHEQDLERSMSSVERWRYNAFVDAGFDPINAQRLALSRIDARQLLRALDRGCSIELALQIFT